MDSQQQDHEREDGMKDSAITLITETTTPDKYGVNKLTETVNTVMCKEGSITRSEFYGAGTNGLRPEVMVTVFHGDYSGQRKATYESKNYAIYRTFPVGDYVELYLKIEGGANGQANISGTVSTGDQQDT
jgi:hypothetical protein